MKLKEIYPLLKGECDLLVCNSNKCCSFELNEENYNRFIDGEVIRIESKTDGKTVYTLIEVRI